MVWVRLWCGLERFGVIWNGFGVVWYGLGLFCMVWIGSGWFCFCLGRFWCGLPTRFLSAVVDLIRELPDCVQPRLLVSLVCHFDIWVLQLVTQLLDRAHLLH